MPPTLLRRRRWPAASHDPPFPALPFLLDSNPIQTPVHWIFKNKDQGKTAATASLGLISLWDVEGGLPAIDKCAARRVGACRGGAWLSARGA
jgi:hypothetical protein